MSLARKLCKLRLLSQMERRVLLNAFFWLPVTSLLLLVVGYKRTLAWLETGQGAAVPRTYGPVDLENARKTARLVLIASNYGPFRTRCLERSLVLRHLLRKQGIPCEVVLAARMIGQQFDAHAWVECEGQVINDRVNIDHHFSAFRQPAPQES